MSGYDSLFGYEAKGGAIDQIDRRYTWFWNLMSEYVVAVEAMLLVMRRSTWRSILPIGTCRSTFVSISVSIPKRVWWICCIRPFIMRMEQSMNSTVALLLLVWERPFNSREYFLSLLIIGCRSWSPSMTWVQTTFLIPTTLVSSVRKERSLTTRARVLLSWSTRDFRSRYLLWSLLLISRKRNKSWRRKSRRRPFRRVVFTKMSWYFSRDDDSSSSRHCLPFLAPFPLALSLIWTCTLPMRELWWRNCLPSLWRTTMWRAMVRFLFLLLLWSSSNTSRYHHYWIITMHRMLWVVALLFLLDKSSSLYTSIYSFFFTIA